MFHHHRIRLGMLAAGGVAAFLVAAGPVAAGSPRAFAVGGGWETGRGVTKHFAFAAHQTSDSTLDANGYVVEEENDPTGVYGDFRVQGPVACLSVVGNGAVIGMTIANGSGIAAGHEGEAFYLYVNDNGGTAPDTFDNSGFGNGTTPDCASQAPYQGDPVIRGQILVRS